MSTALLEPKHSNWLTAQMTLCALAIVSLLYIPIPILAQLADTYNFSASTEGYALSIFGVAYASGFLVFGPLSDLLGRRRIMIFGLILVGITSLGFLLVKDSTTFFILRAIQGFAAASFPPVALAFLAERGSLKQKTWAIACMSTAFLSAALLGQIYGGSVARQWGFAQSLIPLLLIYVITVFFILNTRADKGSATGNSSVWHVYKTIGPLLKNFSLLKAYIPSFVLLMVFVAFYINLDFSYGSWLLQHGVSQIGVREIAIPAFLAPLFLPRLIGRYGPKKVVSAGLFIASVGLLLTALIGANGDYRMLLVATVVYALGVGVSVPGLIGWVSSNSPIPSRGMAISLYTFFLFIGASLGPWLSGVIQNSGSRNSFLILSIIMFVVTILSVTPNKVIRDI